jgi:hypothetical protein
MAKITVKSKKVKTIAERYNLTVDGQRIIRIEIRNHFTRELMETIMRYPNGRPVNDRLVEEKIIDFLNARIKNSISYQTDKDVCLVVKGGVILTDDPPFCFI